MTAQRILYKSLNFQPNFLIISFFSSMFIIIIFAVGLIVLISLSYLHFNKTRKNYNYYIKIPYFQKKTLHPSSSTLNPICSRKKIFFLQLFFQLFLFIDKLHMPEWFSVAIFSRCTSSRFPLDLAHCPRLILK